MLQTLLKIGEWQSQGKSKWDRFLEYPTNLEVEDKHGNSITNYTLEIIFDLDEGEVIIDSDNLKEYDEEDIVETLPLKVKGGNNKAIYTSVPSAKLNQIYKTFFGREGDETKEGQLVEAINKSDAKLLTEDFKKLLDDIFSLKANFIEQAQNKEKEKIDFKVVRDSFELNRNEKIVFINVLIKGTDYGYEKPVSFAKIPEYQMFLEESFFKEADKNKKGPIEKLCYASGNINEGVSELKLKTRYSINKMFVTETRNYASIFDKNKFSLNYQVSGKNQEYLDYASDYLLHQGYKVRIANVDHVIIPQFLSTSKIDLAMALEGINRKSDLLFNTKKLSGVIRTIEDELEDNGDSLFWINYIAFESDGNFFKSTEIIKDISSVYFNTVLKTLRDIYQRFDNFEYLDWQKVMTEYDYETKERVPHLLNFNSLYKIIPLRRDKEKKNKALELFKTILENRKVDKSILYDYFVELILCHYYERYNSYTNVQKYSKDYFHLAVRDSIYRYYALFELLKTLNLTDMEENKIPETTEVSENKYERAEQNFFKDMKLNQAQKAMFYLGRMLNKVEYLQKGKNKTVIQKVNFNGMDKDNIQRLRIDLVEKAKQYNQVGSVVFTDQKFGEYFDFNNWNLNPQEAVFFLLTGYSFGIGIKNDNPKNTKTDTNQ